MSILHWVALAIVAYLANAQYQRIQFSRKKAEFVRDRRRAAGIPDDDVRPFAVARADALSRRSQQRLNEALSTPVKKRKNSMGSSKSQASIDHEAATRLSGIPGTLPGYLRDSLQSQPKRNHQYEASRTATATSVRSPSPTKILGLKTDSPQRAMKRYHSQTRSESASTFSNLPKHNREDSPTAQRDRQRRRKTSPKKLLPNSDQGKAQDVSIPGDFGPHENTTDEDMSDASSVSSASHGSSAAMDEDEDDGGQASPSEAERKHRISQRRAAPLRKLQTAARATAKKREADELDASDTEASLDTTYDDEYAHSQPHSSKRSRTVNKDTDPSSSLDFDIALPEEAMVDFDPAHYDATSTKNTGSGSQNKRQADTSDDRQPGEEWTDFEGLRWRIHPETHELQRYSDVLEWRSKYRMPRDSIHPMARESHQVVVHKWLTKAEWEDAKAKKLLSFQEPERLAEKEKLDKEEAEKMRRRLEVLAKIRQTSSPNKRIQSYLAQRQLQHKLSQGDMSGDISMNTYTTNDTNGDAVSMSIDSASVVGADGATPSKPRSRRISLQTRMTPMRGAEGGAGRESGSTSGVSSPSDSPNRRKASPLASPYRSIAYPKSKKGSSGTSSPLVTSSFPSAQPPL